MTHPPHKGHSNDEGMEPMKRENKSMMKKEPRGGQAMAVSGTTNWPAVFTGWVVAFFGGLILSAIAAAVLGGFGATTQATTTLGIAGGIVGLVVWFIAFFFGGWIAGRTAGHNGVLHGFMVWLIGLAFLILLLIIGAIIGPQAALIGGISIPVAGNLFASVGLAVVILLAVELIASLLGGWLSTRES